VHKWRAGDYEAAAERGDLLPDDIVRSGIEPDAVLVVERNLLVGAGVQRMFNLMTGAGGTDYSATNARICVGDGSPAGTPPTVTNTDTDLACATGATHRYMQQVTSASNAIASGVCTESWIATFASGVANITAGWQEWAIDNGGASGTGAAVGLFNHKGVFLGTKGGTAWTITASVSIS
jgi:hypothetical protein